MQLHTPSTAEIRRLIPVRTVKKHTRLQFRRLFHRETVYPDTAWKLMGQLASYEHGWSHKHTILTCFAIFMVLAPFNGQSTRFLEPDFFQSSSSERVGARSVSHSN